MLRVSNKNKVTSHFCLILTLQFALHLLPLLQAPRVEGPHALLPRRGDLQDPQAVLLALLTLTEVALPF